MRKLSKLMLTLLMIAGVFGTANAQLIDEKDVTVTMDLQVHYVTPQSITVQQTRATPPGLLVVQLLTPGSLVSVSKVTEDKIVLRNRNRSL